MNRAIGAVAIGRNEGERLRLCLQSLSGKVRQIVYVDSGSVDESVDLAHSLGADVVELDLSEPFTAARARNAGLMRLIEAAPDLEFVQFVDGDCELHESWLPTAAAFLQANEGVAVTCGRRRERHPEASPFNRLCDIEWDTPIGEADSCGGDALIRVTPLRSVGGYSEELIAGEEPDLCFRLRQRGWKVVRLDAEMTLHDASMHRVSQWWKRAKRSGYADMEASQRRGEFDPRLRRRVISNLFWALPLSWPLWPILWLRLRRQKGGVYASHIVLGKLPHLVGQVAFLKRRMRGRRPELIEYK